MKIRNLFYMLMGLGLFLITACGSKSTIEKVEGYWLLDLPDNTHMGVTINQDNTGELTLSGEDYSGRNRLILREDIMFTVEGDNLYFTIDGGSGSQAHLYVKDDRLYSNDGQPFRKVK